MVNIITGPYMVMLTMCRMLAETPTLQYSYTILRVVTHTLSGPRSSTHHYGKDEGRGETHKCRQAQVHATHNCQHDGENQHGRFWLQLGLHHRHLGQSVGLTSNHSSLV